MSTLSEDWQVLIGLFPCDWEELGRTTGAVTRLRGFDSLNNLLRTLLLHVGCGWSLRETAVQAKLAGIAEVSDVTLLNRLRQAEDWLRQLCQRLWKDSGVNLEPALKGRPARLIDATTVKEPGKTGGAMADPLQPPIAHAGMRSLRVDASTGQECGREIRAIRVSGWRSGDGRRRLQ